MKSKNHTQNAHNTMWHTSIHTAVDACNCTQRLYKHHQSLHWKLPLGEKACNGTRESNLPGFLVWHFINWNTPPQLQQDLPTHCPKFLANVLLDLCTISEKPRAGPTSSTEHLSPNDRSWETMNAVVCSADLREETMSNSYKALFSWQS